ncbi:uncharacterized protein TNCV_1626311 [Trichonephila clavipes]|nr:uncharacterized protein TNCV_1626311 [Trichonephila clavipes]
MYQWLSMVPYIFLNGVVTAVSLDTGKVVDAKILSQKCSCNFNSDVHSNECSASYIENSRGMEIEEQNHGSERSWWYRYRTVACLVTSSSPVPLKTRRVRKRCTLNLSRAETSSRWCGVVDRRGGASSGVVLVTSPRFKMMRSVTKSSRVAEQCDVNIHSLTHTPIDFQIHLDSLRPTVTYTYEHPNVVLMQPFTGVIHGRGSPMVKVSDHGWHVMSSSHVPLNTRNVGSDAR